MNNKISRVASLILSSGLGVWLLMFCGKLYPLPQLHAAQDLGLFLDPGWRLLQGQHPHESYISPLGPLWAFLTELPLLLFGPFYDSYTLYPAMMSIMFALISLAGTWQRLPSLMAFTFSFIVGLVAGGTYHIGFPPELLTFATHYNRVGFGLLMIVSIVALAPAKDSSLSTELLGGVLCGILAGSLLFLKTNFFAVAAGFGLFGCLVLLPRIRYRFAIGNLIGASVAFLVGFTAIGWNVQRFVRDMGIIARVRSETFFTSIYWIPGTIFWSNIIVILFGVLFVWTLAVQRRFHGAGAVLVILAGTYALGISQSSGSGFGLPGFVAAFFVGCAWFAEKPEAERNWESVSISIFSWGTALIIGFWIVVIPQFISYRTWADVSSSMVKRYGPPKRDTANPLSSLIVNDRNNWGTAFLPLLEEARRLLKQNLNREDSIQFIDFSNPINFGLFKSPKKSYLSTDTSLTISKSNHAPAEDVFSDTDYLLIPKHPMTPEGLELWKQIYGDYVAANYHTDAESENFILLKNENRHDLPRSDHSESHYDRWQR